MVDAVIVDVGDQASCLSEVVVAEENGNVVAPERVDGWVAASCFRIVYDVIMNQRRQVYHFEGDAER